MSIEDNSSRQFNITQNKERTEHKDYRLRHKHYKWLIRALIYACKSKYFKTGKLKSKEDNRTQHRTIYYNIGHYSTHGASAPFFMNTYIGFNS
jgi:hypothetical protein